MKTEQVHKLHHHVKRQSVGMGDHEGKKRQLGEERTARGSLGQVQASEQL